MFTKTKTVAFIGALYAVSGLTAASCFATVSPAYFGEPIAHSNVDRVVKIAPETRWVTVRDGDNVEFVIEGSDRSTGAFAWHFERYGADDDPASAVSLSDIAPGAVAVTRPVTVYVHRNWVFDF